MNDDKDDDGIYWLELADGYEHLAADGKPCRIRITRANVIELDVSDQDDDDTEGE